MIVKIFCHYWLIVIVTEGAHVWLHAALCKTKCLKEDMHDTPCHSNKVQCDMLVYFSILVAEEHIRRFPSDNKAKHQVLITAFESSAAILKLFLLCLQCS